MKKQEIILSKVARENLRLSIRKSGLSIKEIGIVVGISPSTLSGWLTGKRNPSIYRLACLLRMLGKTGAALDVPPPIHVPETLDGLTIEQWRERALAAEIQAEIKRKIDESWEQTSPKR